MAAAHICAVRSKGLVLTRASRPRDVYLFAKIFFNLKICQEGRGEAENGKTSATEKTQLKHRRRRGRQKILEIRFEFIFLKIQKGLSLCLILLSQPPPRHKQNKIIKKGQSRPLFVYFRPFLITISIIQIEKSVYGVLGIWTRGCMMVGADESTELWRPPQTKEI